MDYTVIKYLHVSCAALSYAGFFTRGVLMFRAAPLLEARWVRVVPHVVDTVLLASAIALAAMSRQYPLLEPWLTAKLVALVVYIGLGMMALRRGRTRRGRVVAWIVAQFVFIYIVAVALTRSPVLSPA
ncbi:MAG: SirB2 family protein [Betaproteobacteria bacterium]|nr:MAG: SirB2 family protein [Betaproteobacteria bacterium]